MKPEEDKLLVESFPLLYADRTASMQNTCMCWGFECGSGWFRIVFDLSAKLEPLIAALPDDCHCGHWTDKPHPKHDGECPVCKEEVKDNSTYEWLGQTYNRDVCSRFESSRPRASQVKEKFGGLRFYMTTSTDEMDTLIDEAEAQSYKVCEECGEPSEVDTKESWYLTLCAKCRTERNQKRSPQKLTELGVTLGIFPPKEEE